MRLLVRWGLGRGAAAVGIGALSAMMMLWGLSRSPSAVGEAPTVGVIQPAAAAGEIHADRAYGYLVQICEFGPRPSGSAALEKLRQSVQRHFEACGGSVEVQSFESRHPLTGQPVPMANVIVRWQPDQRRRLLLGAHYDTRPYPDRDPDPRQRNGPFIGANDGASGVALLMELAHSVPSLRTPYGIDFVLFDGEELVYREGDLYFLGSRHFAREYRRNRPDYRYQAAVVLDMIADRDLEIYQEINSLKLAPGLVGQIWDIAQQLNVREFISRPRHEIHDDHLPLNTIADIPACVVIDFDYPAWHTTADTPEQCSAESLAKVGQVMLEWLRRGPPGR